MMLGINTVPDEVLVREYEFFTLDHRPKIDKRRRKKFASYKKIKNRHKSTAMLYVTNRRLIYATKKYKSKKGRVNASIHQTNIKDVGDVTIVNSKWSPLLVPLILMIEGLALIFILMSLSIPLIISSIIGISIFALGVLKYIRGKSVVYLAIGGRESSAGLMVGNVSRNTLGEIYFATRPGKDFEIMVSELGTLILDLQLNGDECLDRWTSGECPNCSAYAEQGELFCRDCGADLKDFMNDE